MGRCVVLSSVPCTPLLLATCRSRQSTKNCITRGLAPRPGNQVICVRFLSPTPPLSYTLALTSTMFAEPVLLSGAHSPLKGVSFVPTQVLTTRPNPSYTVRLIVPVGAS